jgi:hypothetical protein
VEERRPDLAVPNNTNEPLQQLPTNPAKSHRQPVRDVISSLVAHSFSPIAVLQAGRHTIETSVCAFVLVGARVRA